MSADDGRALRSSRLAGRWRGGHAPGHLRDAFSDWVEAGFPGTVTVGWDEITVPACWLLGQLCRCSDTMPSDLRGQCEEALFPIELRRTTYAAAAQAFLRRTTARLA